MLKAETCGQWKSEGQSLMAFPQVGLTLTYLNVRAHGYT